MKTKKILSLVLCLLMLFSTLSLSASAESIMWDIDLLLPGDTLATHFDYVYDAHPRSNGEYVTGGTVESVKYYDEKFSDKYHINIFHSRISTFPIGKIFTCRSRIGFDCILMSSNHIVQLVSIQ